MMAATRTCPCCGQPMREFDQPSMNPDRSVIHMADYQTPACPLYFVTLTAGMHDKLTPAQIAAYAASKIPARRS